MLSHLFKLQPFKFTPNLHPGYESDKDVWEIFSVSLADTSATTTFNGVEQMWDDWIFNHNTTPYVSHHTAVFSLSLKGPWTDAFI